MTATYKEHYPTGYDDWVTIANSDLLDRYGISLADTGMAEAEIKLAWACFNNPHKWVDQYTPPST